jgi:hypothetical protein
MTAMTVSQATGKNLQKGKNAMSEQKQIGQLHAVVIQNLPEMTLEQRQRWIKDPSGLQKFLAGLIEVVRTVVSFITGQFHDTIDYGQSIASLLKAGKYNWQNDDITDKNFLSTETGEREIDYVLFHFKKTMSSEGAIAEMAKENCRPATMKEMLNFGIKHPGVQREFPVVALGSVAMLGGGRRVGILGRYGSERDASLRCFGFDWSDGFRFLAVRI